jgi:23S rRNA pseudouridine1911/1915/1917 synthase
MRPFGRIGARSRFSAACPAGCLALGLSAVAKPRQIELPGVEPIPILYEDRSVIAIDKPQGWMLVPVSWQKTSRNLQAALLSSIAGGDFWAKSRSLKFLRHIHRLDAGTSGVLLFAKSLGALNTFGDLFETRKMEKVYLAITNAEPREAEWTCRLSLAPDPDQYGRVIVDPAGKEAETSFKVLATSTGRWLIEARPYTGRTHQIRVHLAETGCPIEGDDIYGRVAPHGLALRAVGLAYYDPFTHRPIRIGADTTIFLGTRGFHDLRYRAEFRTVVAPPRPDAGGHGSKMGPAKGPAPKGFAARPEDGRGTSPRAPKQPGLRPPPA